MLNTWVFMAFVIISWLLYWLVVPVRLRSLFLALVSFGYFCGNYRREMLFLLALAVLVYIAGFLISRGQAGRKWLVAGLVVALVAVLGYFKYAAFLAEIVNLFLRPLTVSRLSVPEVFIPLGISYFTFKMIHYLVDIGKGKIPRHHLVEFLNYIFFFPILISGPIERFQPFLAQTASLRDTGRGEPAMIEMRDEGARVVSQFTDGGDLDRPETRANQSTLPDHANTGGGSRQARPAGRLPRLSWRGFDIADVYAGLPA